MANGQFVVTDAEFEKLKDARAHISENRYDAIFPWIDENQDGTNENVDGAIVQIYEVKMYDDHNKTKTLISLQAKCVLETIKRKAIRICYLTGIKSYNDEVPSQN